MRPLTELLGVNVWVRQSPTFMVQGEPYRPPSSENVAWPAGRTFQSEVLTSVQPEGKYSSQFLACGLVFLGSFPWLLVRGAALCCLQGVLFPSQQMHRV